MKVFITRVAGNHGLTLLELLVAIALIALIGGVALWSGRGMIMNYRVRGAAATIYSDLQLARLKSLKENKAWALQFSGNTYTIRDDGADGTFNNSDDTIVKTVDIGSEYAGVTIDSSGAAGDRVVFNPDGTAQGSRITLSGGTRTMSLCISSTTGNVRVVDGSAC